MSAGRGTQQKLARLRVGLKGHSRSFTFYQWSPQWIFSSSACTQNGGGGIGAWFTLSALCQSYSAILSSETETHSLQNLHRMAGLVVYSVGALLLFLLASCSIANDTECLYSLLGVSKSASIAEIKRAYRRRALDTHPDKNPNQEQAVVEFRKVVDAFEVLSDPQARQLYDATGKTTQQQHKHSNPFSHWHFYNKQRQRPKLKDNPKVKEAKLRVMHVVSLAQMETVMLNDDAKLERHVLLCFVTPQTEQVMEDILLFPYPFAGMSRQGIWWEDVLQTVIVRHHTPNHELVKYFNVPSDTDTPVLIFMKKNMALSSERAIYETRNRVDFETWVWKQLEVPVTFVNRHTHDVELYWIDGTRANLQTTMAPNSQHFETTMLSHAYVARDARVDAFEGSPGRYKLTPNALLASWTITSTTPSQLVIETKSCIDMSGHCGFWSVNPPGECNRNPGFMHDKCPLTCGVCNEETNNNNTHTDTTADNNDEL